MLHQECQLAGPPREALFGVFLTTHGIEALPATGPWEFAELKSLRETDWLTDSQENDVYVRMPINANK